MLIKNCVQNEDGTLDFDFNVDAEEAAFLMDYAIKSFIHHGIVSLNDAETDYDVDLFPETEGGMQ
jgi:hypothetical protein